MARSRRKSAASRKTRKSSSGAHLWKDGSVGQGRSKSIYIPPTKHDTAVLLAFFNPVPFKRPLKNLLYTIHCLKEAKIPYYVAECVFFDRKPEVPGADLTVRSDSLMFYKEQLLNLLEPLVPEKYTKLVFLDCDILFSAPDWVDQISSKLDEADIIQPFSNAAWLYPDNTRVRVKKQSYGYAIAHNLTHKPPHAFHPGFAWALKRDIFRKIGGFYDKAVVGNGDIMFVFSIINNLDASYVERYAPCILDTWKAYNENVQRIKPSVGYIVMDAFHLFHGMRKDRQYVSRHHNINQRLAGAWDNNIYLNKDGLYEFKHPAEFNKINMAYFKGRNEDVPLAIAMQPTD